MVDPYGGTYGERVLNGRDYGGSGKTGIGRNSGKVNVSDLVRGYCSSISWWKVERELALFM